MRLPALPLATLALLSWAAPAAAQDYYTDVRPLLVEKCMTCHTEEGNGWSMDDAEETYTHARQIAGAVTIGEMPPWIAEPGHQEYLGDLSVGEDVVGMVADWRAAGYPKGTLRPDPVRHADTHGMFATDLSLPVLTGSYLPDQSVDDDYRCFVIDWTRAEAGYVTGFRAVPSNVSVAHHVVVHVIEPGMIDRFREIDDMTEGAG